MLTRLHRTRLISFFALLSSSIPVFSTSGHGYLGVSVGPTYAKLGDSKPKISYKSGVSITDAYPLKSNRSLSATLNVNGGYEFMGQDWTPAVALGVGAYFNPQDYHFNGQVLETAAGNPSSTLYNYKYTINTARLMAEFKLTWILRYASPFIDVGIGSTWNRAKNYQETAVQSNGYPSPSPFQSHTNVNFAYQAGAGVSFTFNFVQSDFLHERVSVGYHYVGFGRTSFGTRGSSYPYPLNIGSLTSNDVYFDYTHLF